MTPQPPPSATSFGADSASVTSDVASPIEERSCSGVGIRDDAVPFIFAPCSCCLCRGAYRRYTS